MNDSNTAQLYDKDKSVKFYDERYKQGYMEDVDIEKGRKIIAIIQELNLPSNGKALDFGCGNGIFSVILQQALPSWKIFGTDISQNAIENARTRYPNSTFFQAKHCDLNNVA